MSGMNMCMSLVVAVLLSLAWAPTAAAHKDKTSFPLVWVCLGITAAGIILVTVLAHFRPADVQRPGYTEAHPHDEDSAKASNNNNEHNVLEPFP